MATLLLGLISVVVYLGYQLREDGLVENAVHYYVQSRLGALATDAHSAIWSRAIPPRSISHVKPKLDTVLARQSIVYLAHLTMHDSVAMWLQSSAPWMRSWKQ